MKSKIYILTVIHKFLKFLFFAFLISIFLLILSLILSWKDWRDFGQAAMQGQSNLKIGASHLQNKNWQEAEISLRLAETNFLKGEEKINNLYNTWLPVRLNSGAEQLSHLHNLNSSGLILSRSALQVNRLASNLSAANFATNTDFKSLSYEQKSAFLQSLIALEPELNGLKANISLVLSKLDSIPRFSLLWPIRAELRELKDNLSSAYTLLDQSLPLLRILPSLSGFPEESNLLIMLQNNDELRPTGGFLGSYVRLDIANFGEIKRLEASDVYHLDMPSIGLTQFEAPEPISKYLKVENWYLRDANWSPDWPQAAKQIQTMFQAESSTAGKEEPSLEAIIGITPDFVAELLRITGPISVRGESYAAENMQALLQYNVEVAYLDEDISSWDRKDIINDLIIALKERLTSLPLSEYPRLMTSLHNSLERKDILIYFNNPAQQKVIEDIKGDGAIAQFSGDYLMVVDANLAAFKTDAVMRKNIFYQVEENDNEWLANLKLSYSHGGGFDWRTTRYQSYTRIFVPLGSKLIEIEGLDKVQADISSYDDKILNKHVIAFFWKIEPGRNREIKISYKLPSNIIKEKNYNLFVQRQPGSHIEQVSFSFKNNRTIEQFLPPINDREIRQSEVYWNDNLDTDKSYKIIFR